MTFRGPTASWRVPVLACVFLSGAAGLIAEVGWIRRAGLAFGATAEGFSTVLAVFFLGIAAGNLFFGEASRAITRPLRVYALVEIVLAAFVVASLPLFAVAEALYGQVYRAAGPSPLATAARVGLIGLVLFVPTVLMGGTLPLLCRQFVADRARVGGTVALLYGTNTLGAAVGAALCGLVLLPLVGTWRALLLAAGMEVVAGTIVAMVSWRGRAVAPVAPAPATRPRRAPAAGHAAPAVVVGALFFCAGFVALGNEVLWARLLALVVRTTVWTYTLSLTAVLAGIVIGSWLAGTLGDGCWRPARLFGALQVAGAIVSLALPLLPPRVWHDAHWAAYLVMLLPPAVLSGALYPLAVRLVVDDPAQAGAAVGRMTAVNIAGGIAGSLAVGFVLLPRLGLHGSLLATTGLALAAGLAAWWLLDDGRPWPRMAATAACVLAWAALPFLLGTRLPQDHLAEPSQLVDFREGREGNLAIVRRRGALVLEADRGWQGQDRKTHQILAAHLPLLLHRAPRRVLVIGVGAGQTPARVLLHDVEQVDCIDIEPGVFELVRAHFDSAWMRDPRVRLLAEDGRSYVAHAASHYDVITLELGQLFRPGVASFYSAELYRDLRARLAPDGIAAQFVPLAFLSPDGLRGLVATFLEVFPQSVLWYNTGELLLLGTNAERFAIPAERLALVASNPALHDDLRYSPWGGPTYHLNQPHVMLAGFLSGPSQLAALAAGAPVERDDLPRLAYASRAVSGQDLNELPLVALLRSNLAPIGSGLDGDVTAATRRAADEVRERNLGDLTASALLRRVDALVAAGDDAAVAALLVEAQRANPDNLQAYRLAGDLALFRGRPADAAVEYARALERDPDDAGSHLGLARALHLQRRGAEAAEHYRAALAAGAEDAEAHNNLAALLVGQGDLEGAERHLEAALRLRPDFAEAAANLARVRTARRSGP